MQQIIIHNCYGIGYRCTTDSFMIKNNIRNYSGPFSYVVIDFQTAIKFINNNFHNYLDTILFKKNTHKFLFNKKKWNHNIFFNKEIYNNFIFNFDIDHKNISDYKKVCIWVHHNLNDDLIKNTIQNRIIKFNNTLNNLNENTLLLFIDNIYENDIENYNYYLNNLNGFNNKTNIYFCILIPIYNYNKEPYIDKYNNNITFIKYKSNYEINSNDIKSKNINWNKIGSIIHSIYNL